ncbi:hypothetical protein Deipr_0221 [Deinococcus proteolyticus MRP]|uniref:DUF11 domain-containing protein n=1 Tax=Deinococcus proteolyticus (strain ATCC 35074 / DSM 20540 / JCM 6276 / NBRC 101906 / NCIMB 13154 / VKM Ac-1939 / CCM 2703 / MRP) TaxID=693977 RepID=F0RIY6_DEIPM|nr:hypothetical protein [Deinococcus proteolyticus]ADY25394.1 hypothetical protein Deipr_0221 [Deinococcus proteolyticus MRP]
MNRRGINALLTLTALLSAPAHAQQLSTSLPLTSVGSHLMWAVGDQTLTLDVGVTGRVRLDLYSPRLDPADYRSADSYGDEQYAPSPEVTTTFVLQDAQGREVLRRTFGPGAHAWEPLIDGELPAGRYRLRTVTQGNGKNTFAVRLQGQSAAVRAEQLTVNVRSATWMPVVNVTTDGPGYALRMYDGDGAGELEARVRFADGRTQALPVGQDVQWADLPLPAEAGEYVIELRQPAAAKQYSNTVSFALQRQHSPVPLTLSQVDETGLLEVTAELLLPAGPQPTQVGAQIDGQEVTVDASLRQAVTAGEHSVQPQAVPGASVSVDAASVTVPRGGVGRTRIQVRPQVSLDLQVDKPQVCVGDVVSLQGHAATDYRAALPLDLELSAPGLKLSGAASYRGELSAEQAARLPLEALASEPGTYTVTLRSPMWEQAVTRTVEVLAAETSVQLRRELPELEPGQEGTVRVLLTNRGTAATSYQLSEEGTGLELLDSGTFSGELAAGETRELSYRVRASQAGEPGQVTGRLTSGTCPVTQESSTQLRVQAPPPEITRSSEVLLPFSAPAQAQSLIVSHRLPTGASYQPGSARLNGAALPDPQVGPSGLLYWEVPTAAPATDGQASSGCSIAAGTLSYSVSHGGALPELAPASLVARYASDRREVLEGAFDADDFRDARPMQAEAAAQENPGAVRLPLAGTVYRTRDKISVTVEKVQGDSSPLLVNGQPVAEDRIGTNTQDGVRGVQRLTYVGVQLRPGDNVLSVGSDRVTVKLAAQTAQVKVEPLQLVADGSTPIRLRITALDEFGTPTSTPTLTLNSNLEPSLPDASPATAGYQLRLNEGVGVLELRPQTVPGELKVDIEAGAQVQPYRFQIRPDQRRFGVGMASATLGLDPQNFSLADDLTWTARGYYEGPIGEGKLFLAADKDGLPHDLDPFERFPLAGDASFHSVPLQGVDPVAAVYDHPRFRASYQRTALPITVLPLGETLTAATLETKTNPKLSAFAAAVPTDQVRLRGEQAIVPDGLRIVRLPDSGISRGSDSLEVVVLERGTGLELRREPLVRFGDYSIDYASGVITLNRELQPLDDDFNDVRIEASYRLDNPLDRREWAYGAQASTEGKNWVAGVAAVQLPTSEGERQTTVGVRAQYDNRENLKAEVRAAYSGGFQASLDTSAQLREHDRAALRMRYQDREYAGLGQFNSGFSVHGTYQSQFSPALRGELEADYRDDFAETQQGYVRGMVDYRLQPFTVGGGLKYNFGDMTGFSAVARAGYTGNPVSVSLEHEQAFSGDAPTTTSLRTSYRLTDTVTLKAQDRYTWGEGHQALLGLDSRLGNTNFSVGYELPTSSGDGNRARFGASTSLPLNKNTALGLRGGTVYSLAGQYLDANLGADLQHRTEQYAVNLGGDIGYSGQDREWRTALRGGVSGSLSDELTLTADALAEFRTSGTGQRLSVGYAYRGAALSSLGYARYVNGTLAGGRPSLTSGITAEYRQPNWAIRAGNDTRLLLDDRGTFSGQAFLGGNYYLNDHLGVGAWGRAFYQPADLQSTLYGYGIEANVRALPGAWLSAGYNFAGFDGLPTGYTYTKPGAYLRLDLTVDESMGGKK